MSRPDAASGSDRREFLKSSAGAMAAGGVVSGLTIAQSAHAAGSDVLKVGLVGCGGRGNGAAVQALKADPNVKITSLGDAFADAIEVSLPNLQKAGDSSRVDVPKERQFVGFDAYKKVIDSGIDVVLLASPPSFRP